MSPTRRNLKDFQEVKAWDEKNPPLLTPRFGSKPLPAEPGVFDESAWGYGDLYLPGGKQVWCSISEAAYLIAEAGVARLRVFDRLDGYTGVAVRG